MLQAAFKIKYVRRLTSVTVSGLRSSSPASSKCGYLDVETADIVHVKTNQNRRHRKANDTSSGTTGWKQKMCSAVTASGEGLICFRNLGGRSAFAARIVL